MNQIRQIDFQCSRGRRWIAACFALFLGVLVSACSPKSQGPKVSPPGKFTFYDSEVTGYTTLKETGGGYEFGIATSVASIDEIRRAIDAKADPTWSSDGWTAESSQDDLDQINYTKGAARLTISIQAYKEEKGRMWYTVDYTYRPSAGPQPQ